MSFSELRKKIEKEKLALREISSLSQRAKEIGGDEGRMLASHRKSLLESLKKNAFESISILEKISLSRTLSPIISPSKEKLPEKERREYFNPAGREVERETLRRIRRKEEKIPEKKAKNPSLYVNAANKLFSNFSVSLLEKGKFRNLKRTLLKANLQFLAKSYVSVILFTTLLSLFAGIFAFGFFLFFNLGPELPIITFVTESIGQRILKIFWIPIVLPLLTFLAMYIYPTLEKNSLRDRIDSELPFATISMSAISGSLIEPSKIFGIIAATQEYPTLGKEFVKLMNEMNIFGYDFVTALRNIASNSPSSKLADLLNDLATTITSGGNLPEFFDKRAQSLLFDYRLEREKYTKSAETFMDIYISVVIAAPMILMLLLIMMKVGGLGVSMSMSLITLIIILGVSLVNIIFLTFLYLKQPRA